MDIAVWLPAFACVSLIIYLLMQRTSASADDSADRMAVLVGARRALGETDASLRKRSIALSRWPFKHETPEVAWWARLLGKLFKH